ncbi:MAG: hypothetical protein U0903_00175 [Planctomycetales bacterium]
MAEEFYLGHEEYVMSENVALKLAEVCIHEYADESRDAWKDHAEAMNCRDCEEFLQKGINAFKFLRYAEEVMRQADYRGIEPFTGDLRETVGRLYRAWFGPCEMAEQWIETLGGQGYFPENLKAFREACDQVQEIVDQQEWHVRAAHARNLRSSDEPW